MPRFVPLNVSAVPEVIVEPLKKFTPLVTWVEVPVPPLAIERSLTRLRVPRDAVCAKRFVEEAVVEKRLVVVAFPKMLPPLQVLLLESNVVDAPVNVVCVCQYAADVVENARP